MRKEEIYTDASYRIRGRRGVLTVTRIEATYVHYQGGEFANSMGSMPIELFASNAERVYPDGDPALKRGIAMLKLGRDGKSLSFQNDEIAALLSALGASQ